MKSRFTTIVTACLLVGCGISNHRLLESDPGLGDSAINSPEALGQDLDEAYRLTTPMTLGSTDAMEEPDYDSPDHDVGFSEEPSYSEPQAPLAAIEDADEFMVSFEIMTISTDLQKGTECKRHTTTPKTTLFGLIHYCPTATITNKEGKSEKVKMKLVERLVYQQNATQGTKILECLIPCEKLSCRCGGKCTELVEKSISPFGQVWEMHTCRCVEDTSINEAF